MLDFKEEAGTVGRDGVRRPIDAHDAAERPVTSGTYRPDSPHSADLVADGAGTVEHGCHTARRCGASADAGARAQRGRARRPRGARSPIPSDGLQSRFAAEPPGGGGNIAPPRSVADPWSTLPPNARSNRPECW